MLKLFKGLKPYALLIACVLVLVFISTMTDLELPDLMSEIVNTGIVQGDVPYILGRGGIMLLVALIGTACTILTSDLMIVGAMIRAVNKDIELSKVIFIVIPIIVLTIIVIAKFTMPMFEKMQKRIDRLNLVVRENLTGIRVIRVFNKVSREQERFNEASIEVSKIATIANRLMGALMPLMMLILNLSIIAVIWFGGIRIDGGDLMVGNLWAFFHT